MQLKDARKALYGNFLACGVKNIEGIGFFFEAVEPVWKL